MNLLSFEGKEVYIITGQDEDVSGDIFITTDLEKLQFKLSHFNPLLDNELRVFHGILNAATALPSSLKGKNVYVIVIDAKKSSDLLILGSLFESACTDPNELATEIESIIHVGASPIAMTATDIENVYLLYGYQMRTILSVDIESIDDEIISTCTTINQEITTIKRSLNGSKKWEERKPLV